MTGPEHYRAAEQARAAIDGKTEKAVATLLAIAQVHATLALAAATALALDDPVSAREHQRRRARVRGWQETIR